MSNTTRGASYTFNINNLANKDSQYKYGMRPLMYSMKKNKGWERCGHNIHYFENHVAKTAESGTYNTLSFQTVFDFDDDEVYFAQNYPYTYTDLMSYLARITGPANQKKVRAQPLCTTLAGNEALTLLITDFDKEPAVIAKREGIVLTARVHSGGSQASYVMEGTIDFLIGSTKEARFLRENFVFKIVPMINIDGVINGNTRSSLAGLDLNRQYHGGERQAPEINALRAMMDSTREAGRNMFMYCDFHGHSTAKNLFLFGCHNNYSGPDVMRERIFPLLFH